MHGQRCGAISKRTILYETHQNHRERRDHTTHKDPWHRPHRHGPVLQGKEGSPEDLRHQQRRADGDTLKGARSLQVE